MPQPDPQSETSQHQAPDAGHGEPQQEPPERSEPEDAEKHLEDLDAEDEEALGVQGGQRTFGRYGKRL